MDTHQCAYRITLTIHFCLVTGLVKGENKPDDNNYFKNCLAYFSDEIYAN